MVKYTITFLIFHHFLLFSLKNTIVLVYVERCLYICRSNLILLDMEIKSRQQQRLHSLSLLLSIRTENAFDGSYLSTRSSLKVIQKILLFGFISVIHRRFQGVIF